jgi:hypothetical protein
MTLKKYQPERTDFLINTDWGIPADVLSAEEAKSGGKKLFHGRWVTKEGKKQLREEHAAYQSVRVIGGLLIIVTLYLLMSSGRIFQEGINSILAAGIYGAAMLTAGIGIIKFRTFARNIALLIFLSFVVLPFTPILADDKGSPLIIILGLSGFYYLLRRPARKIFATPSIKNAEDTKLKRFIFRKAIYAALLILAFLGIYTIYDLQQARIMAVDTCNRAAKGMPLDDFLSRFPKNDYKIIKDTEHIMIVPKRGLGRSSCTVSHDGQKITGSKTGFND